MDNRSGSRSTAVEGQCLVLVIERRIEYISVVDLVELSFDRRQYFVECGVSVVE